MFNPINLQGKRVLITGASSGIGRSTAIYLSRLGAKVIAVGRDTVRLSETLTNLEGDGHHSVVFDLVNCDEIPGWLKDLTGKYGQLDGLVHCAGVQFTLPVRATTTQQFDDLMRVNVTAAFALAKGLRQRRVCTDATSLVFISSIMGIVGQPGISTYCCSKGALISLTKSLALEFSRENIRVNCIAPGFIDTKMTREIKANLTTEQFEKLESMHPLGFGEPEDIAASIAFLMSSASRWITGTCMTVDGGYTAH